MAKRICFLDVDPLVAVKVEDPIDQPLYEKFERITQTILQQKSFSTRAIPLIFEKAPFQPVLNSKKTIREKTSRLLL